MTNETRYLTVRGIGWEDPRAEVRLKGNRLSGYGVVFESLSQDLGGFVEKIARGSVELVADVLSTRDHDRRNLLGRTSSGTLAVTVDDVGVRYEVELPNTTAGQDTRELVRRGDLSGSSFTFQMIEEKWSKVGKTALRTLTRLMLHELGPVVSPAYLDTTAAVRSLEGARGEHRLAGPNEPGRLLEHQKRLRVTELRLAVED